MPAKYARTARGASWRRVKWKEASFVDIVSAAGAVNNNILLLIQNNTFIKNSQLPSNFKEIISCLFNENQGSTTDKVILGNQIINNDKLKDAVYKTTAFFYLMGNIGNIASQNIASLENNTTIQGIADSYGFTPNERSIFVNGLKTAAMEIATNNTGSDVQTENQVISGAIQNIKNSMVVNSSSVPNTQTAIANGQNANIAAGTQQEIKSQNIISGLKDLSASLGKTAEIITKSGNIDKDQMQKINIGLADLEDKINNVVSKDLNTNTNNQIKEVQNTVKNIMASINTTKISSNVPVSNAVDADGDLNNIVAVQPKAVPAVLSVSNNVAADGDVNNKTTVAQQKVVPAVLTVSNTVSADEVVNNKTVVAQPKAMPVVLNIPNNVVIDGDVNNNTDATQPKTMPTISGALNTVAADGNVNDKTIIVLSNVTPPVFTTSKIPSAKEDNIINVIKSDAGSSDTTNDNNNVYNQEKGDNNDLINKISTLLDKLNGKIEIVSKPGYVFTAKLGTLENTQKTNFDAQTLANNNQGTINNIKNTIKEGQAETLQIDNIKEEGAVLPQIAINTSVNLKATTVEESQVKTNAAGSLDYNKENFGDNTGNKVNVVAKELLGKNEDYKYNIENKSSNDMNWVLSNVAAIAQNTTMTQNTEQIFPSVADFAVDTKKDIIIKQIVDGINNVKDSMQFVPKTEIKMVLRPENLGPVIVSMEHKNGILKGTIQVADSGVRNVLKANLADLKGALNNIGVHTQDIDVALNQNLNNGSQFEQGQSYYKEWEGAALNNNKTNIPIETAIPYFWGSSLNYLA